MNSGLGESYLNTFSLSFFLAAIAMNHDGLDHFDRLVVTGTKLVDN